MGGIRAGASERTNVRHSAIALGVALALGAVSILSPIAALLALALLAARALMRTDAARVDILALAGPAFAALIVGAFVGLAGAIGVLFAWRLLADARWSIQEAARLSIAAGQPAETKTLASIHAWLTPLYGLAIVAYTAPHMVAGLPLDLPHLPALAPMVVGFVAAAAVVDWLLRHAADWRLGELALAPAAHLFAHHLIFLLAFGLAFDVSAGIVAMFAWRLVHAAPLRLGEPKAQASFTAVP